MSKTIAQTKVLGQRVLNSSTKLIEVYAPEIAAQAVPGQFVNVKVCKNTAPLLRRPFGVAGVNKEKGTMTMIYRIIGEGVTDILMGGRTADELFWTKLYEGLSKEIFLTTDDGSAGTKGTVMALLPQLLKEGGYDCVYVCGPVPMMRAVANACLEAGVKCQVSLEKYMACGLGACLSCACEGIGKRIKVCKDGPVFWAEEVGEW